MAIRNQIVGVIRFSYPATDGFAVSGLGAEALARHLYAPDRLARRFACLETINLPSLAAQTDGDFTCVLLAGDTLPASARDRLLALADRRPFLRVLFLPRTGALPAARRAFRHATHQDSTHVTGFRLDDDDALAVDYVARTRDRADRLIAAGFANGPTAIAFTRGLYWDMLAPDAPFHAFREPSALGLACAMITSAALETCVYRYNHRRIASFVPTYLEPGGAEMFLRTLHDTNDSGRTVPPHASAVPLAKGRRLLASRFGLDPDAALALMAGPVP